VARSLRAEQVGNATPGSDCSTNLDFETKSRFLHPREDDPQDHDGKIRFIPSFIEILIYPFTFLECMKN
jgi:hypothetical protein